MIKSNKIYVNGKIAKIGCSVSVDDEIKYLNQIISWKDEKTEMVMLNKPERFLSRSKDNRFPIVYDLLPKLDNNKWISVGRLDLNTSGLMLFTNNGDFANYCMHPSSYFDKEYLVRARNFNQRVGSNVARYKVRWRNT